MTGRRTTAGPVVLRAILRSDQSTQRVSYFSISVKSWAERLPSVEAVRPTRCLVCGIASRAESGRLMLHGHGIRPRSVFGPTAVGKKPVAGEILQRRYACQRCGAVVVSRPREIGWRLLYTLAAIAFALGLWSHGRVSAREVREKVSPFSIVGATSAARWRSLARWAKGARSIWPRLRLRGPPRTLAEHASAFVATFSPMATGNVPIDAFAGATHVT